MAATVDLHVPRGKVCRGLSFIVQYYLAVLVVACKKEKYMWRQILALRVSYAWWLDRAWGLGASNMFKGPGQGQNMKFNKYQLQVELGLCRAHTRRS